MNPHIALHPEQIAEFCAQNSIKALSLFGSVLRDDFGPASDIDVLVEFFPGRAPSFFALQEMENELTTVFGRRVDLVSKRGLRGRIREHVLAQGQVQHVTAG